MVKARGLRALRGMRLGVLVGPGVYFLVSIFYFGMGTFGTAALTRYWHVILLYGAVAGGICGALAGLLRGGLWRTGLCVAFVIVILWFALWFILVALSIVPQEPRLWEHLLWDLLQQFVPAFLTGGLVCVLIRRMPEETIGHPRLQRKFWRESEQQIYDLDK